MSNINANYCPYCKHRLPEINYGKLRPKKKRKCMMCGKSWYIREVEE